MIAFDDRSGSFFLLPSFFLYALFKPEPFSTVAGLMTARGDIRISLVAFWSATLVDYSFVPLPMARPSFLILPRPAPTLFFAFSAQFYMGVCLIFSRSLSGVAMISLMSARARYCSSALD